jgi:hypothetical protein
MVTIGGLGLVLLITAIASGCSPGTLRGRVAQPDPTREPKETQDSPGPGRLQDDNTQAPTQSPAPASSQQSPPEPLPPSQTPPAPRQEEPDPREVIDWLYGRGDKKVRRATRGGRRYLFQSEDRAAPG